VANAARLDAGWGRYATRVRSAYLNVAAVLGRSRIGDLDPRSAMRRTDDMTDRLEPTPKTPETTGAGESGKPEASPPQSMVQSPAPVIRRDEEDRLDFEENARRSGARRVALDVGLIALYALLAALLVFLICWRLR
jgi:hypothetical protein